MKIPTPLRFLLQAVTAGLALAFVVLVWKPQLLGNARVVEFIESNTPPAARVTPASGPVSYAAAVRIAAPAVVNVYTQKVVHPRGNSLFDDPLFRHFFGDNSARPRNQVETSLGSGVIVSDKGYILTNNHVIDGAEEIEVALRDGRTARATVVGSDPEADLAVLKVGLDKLPVITLGHSENLQVGDVVLAIGNPYGVGQTVTLGIVSATGRDQLGINTFENFIQTDAAINPGNSGGALIDATGRLVGINTAIFSRSGGSQGIGFAIPVSLARGVMTQIVEKGHVVRGWLGIEVQDITPALMESFNLKSRAGVIVAGVLRNGPADRAGLKPGDIVTRIGGQPVKNVHSALTLISRKAPGDRLELLGTRGDQKLDLTAVVAERPIQKTAN